MAWTRDEMAAIAAEELGRVDRLADPRQWAARVHRHQAAMARRAHRAPPRG